MLMYRLKDSALLTKLSQDTKEGIIVKVAGNTVIADMCGDEQQVKRVKLLLSYFSRMVKMTVTGINDRFKLEYTFEEIPVESVLAKILSPVQVDVTNDNKTYVCRCHFNVNKSLFESSYYTKQFLLSLLGNTTMVIDGEDIAITVEVK